MHALRRAVAGLALGAMAVLWWWAFDVLGASKVLGPDDQRAGSIVTRAPFGREMRSIEYVGHGRVGGMRSNQTFLAGYAILLGGECALGTVAAWALGARVRPQAFEKRRPESPISSPSHMS